MNFLGKKICGVENIIFVACFAEELNGGYRVAVGTDFFFFYEGA